MTTSAKRRVRHGYFGFVRRTPKQESGAIAQCSFCEWGCWVAERKRKKWSALDRAAAKLRAHERTAHQDKFTHYSTAEEIFGKE